MNTRFNKTVKWLLAAPFTPSRNTCTSEANLFDKYGTFQQDIWFAGPNLPLNSYFILFCYLLLQVVYSEKIAFSRVDISEVKKNIFDNFHNYLKQYFYKKSLGTV